MSLQELDYPISHNATSCLFPIRSCVPMDSTQVSPTPQPLTSGCEA